MREDTLINMPTLVRTEERLELFDPASETRVWVEFSPAELQRFRPGASGRDLLRRAIGSNVQYVADATAGLARDSAHLICLGYTVSAIERHPLVAAIAQDGIERAQRAGLLPTGALTWHTGDARQILPTLTPAPQVVYLDPMFPPKRKKTAAVRKEMQLLRLLVENDEDAAELLAIARRCATERVVVKRADDAPLLAPDPMTSYTGKLVRYDVYKASHD